MRPLAVAVLLLMAGCNGDDGCVELSSDCAPLYEPTYPNVFNTTLVTTCGTGGSACHASEGARANLVLDDVGTARINLLAGRIAPGDASCSLVMARLESDDPEYQMPPRAKLSDAERCAIQKWIADGAKP